MTLFNIKTRDGVEIILGLGVKHFDRKIYRGTLREADDDRYIGVVRYIDSARLPLIGVDCGGEFIRWLPHSDIVTT